MYDSLRQCVNDLDRLGEVVKIKTPVDPDLEISEIHRRIHDAQGPAILFENIIGSKFPGLSNLYGTTERIEYLFHKSIPLIKALGALRSDPSLLFKKPSTYLGPALKSRYALPRKIKHRHLAFECKIEDLPQIRSWPKDGGAFILLPQVLTLPPGSTNLMESNLGMYRIQLSGNQYIKNKEIGLHYQLHRGIGNHHRQYLDSDQPFKASIFIGGPPANALAAIFPLPEGMSELTFAGLLNGRRFPYSYHNGYYLSEQADFVITGTIDKSALKPEGPFGDHLGYYSLQHDFPVLKVDKVYHRTDAIWHFTVVGRPPQEDSYFGYLIHQLVQDLIPKEFPGLKQMHAVDAAGVHPLLLAIGKERYMPFRERRPEEILTIAHRILGSGQTSLAKFVLIAADDDPTLDTHDYSRFFDHLLSRLRFDRDLHFITQTTIDTLDYSGESWNAGSKIIMACHGAPIRSLLRTLPENFRLPGGFDDPTLFHSGILCVKASTFTNYQNENHIIEIFAKEIQPNQLEGIAWIILVDDAHFTSSDWKNFLWVTFTRSNPAQDIYGVKSFTNFKHWGCHGPLIIDARIKPHHAPVLEVDPITSRAVDQLFAKGGPLYSMDKKKTKPSR